MRPKKELTISIEQLDKLLKSAKTKSEYQKIQCMRFRILYPQKTAKEIAAMVGISVGSVWKLHSTFLKEQNVVSLNDKRGGRFHANMTMKEEEALLKPFLKEAITHNNTVDVSKIKVAYEEKIGKQVPKSTIYRMLDRHGWKKIVSSKIENTLRK